MKGGECKRAVGRGRAEQRRGVGGGVAEGEARVRPNNSF